MEINGKGGRERVFEDYTQVAEVIVRSSDYVCQTMVLHHIDTAIAG